MKQRKLRSLFGLIWTKRAMNRLALCWTMQILNRSLPICIRARRSSSSKIANANTERRMHVVLKKMVPPPVRRVCLYYYIRPKHFINLLGQLLRKPPHIVRGPRALNKKISTRA
jgi:hypothetical protein